jgi:mono/diheme cytochrome c family protein
MRRTHFVLPLLSALVVTACSKSSTSAPAAPAGPALPPGVTAQMVAQGDSIYNNTVPQLTSCARCHGVKGVGGQNGPSLVEGAWLHSGGTYDEIVATITTGIPQARIKDPARRFGMQPRGGQVMNLTDPQIRLVAAYVFSISRAKPKA